VESSALQGSNLGVALLPVGNQRALIDIIGMKSPTEGL